MSGTYDPGLLRRRLKPFHLSQMYRMIPEHHRGTPLGTGIAPSRFSDPAGKFAVLYAADSVPCAFWESMVRDRFTRVKRRTLSKHEVRTRLVVMLRSTRSLSLVDLRSDGPIRIGAPTAVAHDKNHAAGRALAAAVHDTLPKADGFLYPSRFTGHNCVAIFDRAIRKLKALGVTPLITHTDFLAALDDYEIVLVEPPN